MTFPLKFDPLDPGIFGQQVNRYITIPINTTDGAILTLSSDAEASWKAFGSTYLGEDRIDLSCAMPKVFVAKGAVTALRIPVYGTPGIDMIIDDVRAFES